MEFLYSDDELLKITNLDRLPTFEESRKFINSQKLDFPEILYRYCSVGRLIQVLEENRIFIQSPSQMNDVYDYFPELDWTINKNEILTVLNKIFEKNWHVEIGLGHLNKDHFLNFLLNEVENIEWSFGYIFGAIFEKKIIDARNNARILSFSEDFENELLWAHYGDSHKGVCIGFDFTTVENSFKIWLSKVDYTDIPVSINPYNVILDKGKYLVSILDSIQQKNQCWSYEKEWRFSFQDQYSTSKKFKYLYFKKFFINLIIFGERTGDEEITKCLPLLTNEKVKLYKCVILNSPKRKMVYKEIIINDFQGTRTWHFSDEELIIKPKISPLKVY